MSAILLIWLSCAAPVGAQPGPAPSDFPSPSAPASPVAAPAAEQPGGELGKLMVQAKELLDSKDFAGSRQALDRALALDPANPSALAFRAWLNTGLNRPSEAISDLRALLNVSISEGLGPVVRIAKNWIRAGRYSDAKAVLELLRPQDRDAEAWYSLARAHNGLRDRAAVIQALKEASRLDRRYAATLEAALRAGLADDLGPLLGLPAGAGSGQPAAKPPAGAPPQGVPLLPLGVGGLVLLILAVAFAGRGAGPHAATTEPAAKAPPKAAQAKRGAAAARAGPKRIGSVELVREIGSGGMGIVYEGNDLGLHRRVAVKKMREEIRIDPREKERFLTEARLVARLKHENIVAIHSILEDGEDIYLVFEFVEGDTLSDLLDRRNKVTLPEAIGFIERTGEALAYAHGRDVVHRDLKPSNIMLTPKGALKVMDFGVARQAKDAVSRRSFTSTVVGTPPYMAPEQEQGVVCKESDVYALAICLYELITGQLPFEGVGTGMLFNKVNKSYTPATLIAPDLPDAMDKFFDKAFEPDPSKRHRSVAEFLDGLRAAAG